MFLGVISGRFRGWFSGWFWGGFSGHGALVDLLSKEKVEVLLCGGIGGGALSALAEAGIKVVGGAQGGAVRTVMAYLAGTLETEANFRCNHHHLLTCSLWSRSMSTTILSSSLSEAR